METGFLSGIVKDEKGAPIKGALVNSVYTNSEGRYKIERLNKGKEV